MIWSGHPDAQAQGLFPPTDGERGLDMDERWQLLRPFDQPEVLRPTINTPLNIRCLNKSSISVEDMQIHEYLTNVPQVGRRDYKMYPPRYADLYYVPPLLEDHR